jgi:hypothetical protein
MEPTKMPACVTVEAIVPDERERRSGSVENHVVAQPRNRSTSAIKDRRHAQ